MSRNIWRCVALSILNFAVPHALPGQSQTSKPLSEVTIKAGNPFTVTVQLQVPGSLPMQAFAYYETRSAPDPNGVSNLNTNFSCRGDVPANKLAFKLQCEPNGNSVRGEYRADNGVLLVNSETGDRKQYPGVRLPIVTIATDPRDVSFPIIAGATLSLTDRQSLTDGAVRAQQILNSVSSHFPINAKDSPETRAYLLEQIEDAKRVVELTRQRFQLGMKADAKLPSFFEDFDLRFDQIIRNLGASPSRISSRKALPHLLLVQLPRTNDSVTATAAPGELDKHLGEFVVVITDLIKGFFGMGDSGQMTFSWAVMTEPQGADLFVSRLGKPEQKWAGVTNFTAQNLDKAIWTFRVDWKGCSKTETPDPFLQAPIQIKMVKAGCKKR